MEEARSDGTAVAAETTSHKMIRYKQRVIGSADCKERFVKEGGDLGGRGEGERRRRRFWIAQLDGWGEIDVWVL